MIRYAYGLYDEYLLGCNLTRLVFRWANPSRVPEDLQYCASTPVDAVSIDSCHKHHRKELGGEDWEQKLHDVGL